jgi:hypothetical protein
MHSASLMQGLLGGVADLLKITVALASGLPVP